MIRDELHRDPRPVRRRAPHARSSADESDLTIEDLIAPQDVVVTLSHGGYAKSQPVSEYRAQRRGGRGKSATAVKDEDFVDKLFVANTHDTLLCFSSRGQLYWLKVYQLPQAGRGCARQADRQPAAAARKASASPRCCRSASSRKTTTSSWPRASGTVKKTPLAAFSRPRTARHHRGRASTRATSWSGVAITDGTRDIMLFTTERQGHPLRRRRRAPDGPQRRGRARHPPAGGRARSSR